MKTVLVNIYKFNELSEEAKENALSKLSDINVGYEWWESVYYDAENVGLEISSFDTYRGDIDIDFASHAIETAYKIISEHGEKTETHLLAFNFLKDWNDLVAKHSDGIDTSVVHEDKEYYFNKEADELEKEFLQQLNEEYLSILNREYEYQISKEAIIETIEANDYDFTENGELY